MPKILACVMFVASTPIWASSLSGSYKFSEIECEKRLLPGGVSDTEIGLNFAADGSLQISMKHLDYIGGDCKASGKGKFTQAGSDVQLSIDDVRYSGSFTSPCYDVVAALQGRFEIKTSGNNMILSSDSIATRNCLGPKITLRPAN